MRTVRYPYKFHTYAEIPGIESEWEVGATINDLDPIPRLECTIDFIKLNRSVINASELDLFTDVERLSEIVLEKFMDSLND